MKTLLTLLLTAVTAFASNNAVITITNTGTTTLTDLAVGYTGGFYETFHVIPGVFTLAPGAHVDYPVSWEASGDGGTDYIDWAVVKAGTGYSLIGNSFVTDGSGTIYVSYATGSAANGWTPSAEVGDGVLVPQATPDTKKTLWVVADETLTADLFREGIDKVVAANPTTTTGGGSSDFASSDTEYMHNKQRGIYDAQFSGEFTVPEIPGKAAAMASAKTEIEAAMSERAIAGPGDPGSGGASDIFNIALGHTGHVLHLNPVDDANMSVLAAWMRGAFAWVVFMSFQFFLWNYFKEIYLALAGSQPAKGNPVAGGTGGQATSLLVAIAMTAAIVSVPTLFWALADSGLGWASAITSTANPTQTAASGANFLQAGLHLFETFLPVGTLLSALSSYLIILRGGLILLAGAQTVVRFFVF